MTTTISDRSWTVQGYRWDLKYSALAIRALQMTCGSLESLTARITEQSMGLGLSLDMQVLIIWAGQQSTDRKATLKSIKRRLIAMGDKGRALLITWAAADYCNAILQKQSAGLPQPATDEDVDDE
jgi:hypothetical protein